MISQARLVPHIRHASSCDMRNESRPASGWVSTTTALLLPSCPNSRPQILSASSDIRDCLHTTRHSRAGLTGPGTSNTGLGSLNSRAPRSLTDGTATHGIGPALLPAAQSRVSMRWTYPIFIGNSATCDPRVLCYWHPLSRDHAATPMGPPLASRAAPPPAPAFAITTPSSVTC